MSKSKKSRIDSAIQFIEENETMLNDICTKEESKAGIVRYILHILKHHKAELLYRNPEEEK